MSKPLNNEWFRNQASAAFQLHQKIHAFNLHFMTGYSYPRYNGRTRMTMESFLAKHRHEMGYYTRLWKKFQEGISAEKFLYVGRVFGYTRINELENKMLMKHFWYWIENYGTKEDYDRTVRAYLSRRDPDHSSWWSAGNIPHHASDVFADLLAMVGNRGDSRDSCDALHAAIWLNNKTQAPIDDAILKLQHDRMLKFQDFVNWWCLL